VEQGQSRIEEGDMSSGKHGPLGVVALIVTIIGAINWGIMGILNKDLIMGILGLDWDLARIIYIVVGVAGVWSLIKVLPSNK
jgi:uncharacterized membrane protein YuzA (DUF378 family)